MAAVWCCSRVTASALRTPALASTPGTGTAASGDVTASGKHRFVAHVGDELLVDLADSRLSVSDCSGEVRRVSSAGRSADRLDLTGYRQPAEPVEEEPAAAVDFADTRGISGS